MTAVKSLTCALIFSFLFSLASTAKSKKPGTEEVPKLATPKEVLDLVKSIARGNPEFKNLDLTKIRVVDVLNDIKDVVPAVADREKLNTKVAFSINHDYPLYSNVNRFSAEFILRARSMDESARTILESVLYHEYLHILGDFDECSVVGKEIVFMRKRVALGGLGDPPLIEKYFQETEDLKNAVCKRGDDVAIIGVDRRKIK
jgi:hypothetical protein